MNVEVLTVFVYALDGYIAPYEVKEKGCKSLEDVFFALGCTLLFSADDAKCYDIGVLVDA